MKSVLRKIWSILLVIVIGVCSNQNFIQAVTVVSGGTVGVQAVSGGTIDEGEEITEDKEEIPQKTEEVKVQPVTSAGVKLRLMYTSDIHGQVTDYDYQSGKTLSRGLSRVYTLMKDARKQVGDNYLTFDVGDSVMNYTTDYIQAQDSSALQPVYSAMAKIGYDAITLGNHDFDYGYEYIVNQLEKSGLMDKVVLSNVTSAINGKYVFGQENRIIKKQVTDEEGNIQTIHVGIFGVTLPTMSTRTESLKSMITSEDMIETAKQEAALLKKNGADIVIALAHTGFGTEEPAKRSADVAYALTKIPEIDVILAGHQHVYYPNNAVDAFYKFPGTDRETGLVNGKRMLILKDRCRSLGIVDLNLRVDAEGRVELQNSDYEFRKVTSKTANDSKISSEMNEWDEKIKKYSSKKIGEIAAKERWQNYTAFLEDTEAIQVVHDAEMQYAARYIANHAPEYKDYPIISMAKYVKYGSDSAEDYVDMTGNIYQGMLQNLASYKKYVYLYEITGEQLREYLEWGVYIYQTNYTSGRFQWDDRVISEYIKNGHGESVLQDEYLNDWSRFFVWNGIEYVVDNTQEPRYNSAGNKVRDTRRIVSMTYNGQEIKDEQKFVLCTEKSATDIPLDVQGQVIAKSHVLTQNIISEYLAGKQLLGNISVHVDKNWKLQLPDQYRFIIKSGSGAKNVFEGKNWYESVYSTLGAAGYYQCTYKKEQEENKDTQGANVVLAAENLEETNDSVGVHVLCNDVSGIKRILYIQGKEDAHSKVWKQAIEKLEETETVTPGAAEENGVITPGAIEETEVAAPGAAEEKKNVVTPGGIEELYKPTLVEGNRFEVTKSGVYSVYVEDGAGNVTVEQIAITNIYPESLLKPTVNTVTNKQVKVTGTAEPNTTIHVISGKTKYQGKVSADGRFSVKISPQKAGTVLSVYITDKKGRSSKKTKITVTRKGPNCPTISSAKNNDTSITGKTNDNKVSIYAILNNTVYVSKKLGTGYYKTCKGYNPELPVRKSDITIKNDGTYTITIPNQYYGVPVKVYAVDNLGRISYGRSVNISKASPNRVAIYTPTDVEGYVFGYIPNDKSCKVAIKKNNGSCYYGTSDSKGYFSVKVGKIKEGDVFTGYAKIGSGSYSYPSKKTAISVHDVYADNKDTTSLAIYKITDKDKNVTGKSDIGTGKVYVQIADKAYAVKTDKNGKFNLVLSSYQKIGSTIYVVSRNTRGSMRNVYCRKVVLGPPRTPVFISGVKKDSKKVVAKVSEKCSLILKVNKKKYTAPSVKYSKSQRTYIYTFKTGKLKEKQKLTLYAKNSGGTTKSSTKTIKESKKTKK